MLTISKMMVDYEVNPLGIDAANPALSWQLRSDRSTQYQSAYRILVSLSSEALDRDIGDCWDSGQVVSGESQHRIYEGNPFQSGTRYYWKVKVWDEESNESEWSDSGWWETGLLSPSDWQAKWITAPFLPDPQPEPDLLRDIPVVWDPQARPNEDKENSRRYFRLSFAIDGELPEEAKLHVYATDSLYIHVNGEDEGLYYPYMQAVTLDIADLLREGSNLIACAADGEHPGFIAALSLRYSDGRAMLQTTESNWKTFDIPEEGWISHDMDDSHWRSPVSIGRFGHDSWEVYKRILYPVNKAYGPCPRFRAQFRVDKPVLKARLYISALGIYQGYLNGRQIGNDVFAPGWTDYRTRIPYQTYDLTSLIQDGDNSLEAIVGSGWYAGNLGICGPYHYGKKVGLRAQLLLEFSDHTQEVIFSDTDWQSAESPVVAADMYMGETFDARKLMAQPEWQASLLHEELPGGLMSAQQGPPIQRIEEIVPKSIVRHDERTFIVDLGQNMVGWVRLKMQGAESGKKIRIRYAERLEMDGSLYRANLRTAKQTDVYIAGGGNGEESYEPKFTYHGFQYVEIQDYPGELTADQITGIVVHSAADPVIDMETSNPSINKLLDNIRWSQKGNFFGIPLDCPQRDERLGWLGDAHAFARTATYNMNAAGFYTKWLTDIRDAQAEDGAIPDIAPFVEHFGYGHVFFADGGVIIPWIMYQVYGDTRFIETNYDAMARWIDWMIKDSDEQLIRKSESFGDHLSHGADTPPTLINAAFFAYSVQLMEKMALIVGKRSDSESYGELFERLKLSFQKRFVRDDGMIESETQTAYVLALKIGLLPEELIPLAFRNLLDDIRERDWHLTTGFMGVSYVLSELAERGETDVAYRLLLQDTFPSWLYSVRNGATTIWERWDGWTNEKGFQDPEMNSFNHYALGSVGEWIYRFVAGIDLQDGIAGYRTFKIQPRPGGGFTHASCRYETLYGTIVSSWRIENGIFTLHAEVPVNTEALIMLPKSGKGITVGSGKYEFSVAGWA
ncbi:rhamnosidase [Paenibacillus baekrokdamisoli]|uniref:alpha-L-rhamnosidase n=1 Tax=Paenibacillus baekrokdamisoli TaxID=1712516 RepID=A0A3G9JF84_9BACL|nr:family 78 glycoside hydrolase catalytic domain [Paenibacillus baekrokdamisoli]MBB3068807.1 alpha-L-rhamnosidase [Paenibacillus baekrokdamisoli]BBH23633.1 rhamnosidase [Paenibacillus baekrokdamisoli]